MVVVLVPVLAIAAGLIGRFYRRLARSLQVPPGARLDMAPAGSSQTPVLVPVEEINLATVMALGEACKRSADVTAVHVIVDPDEPSHTADRWASQFPQIPLVLIDSPYRTVSDPMVAYVTDRLREGAHEIVVLVPVLDVGKVYERPLVNQSLKGLVKALTGRRHVTVETSVFSLGAKRRARAF
jgi:hypothetical protein